MVKRYTCWGDITWRDEAGVDHAPPDGMDVRVVLAADCEALEAEVVELRQALFSAQLRASEAKQLGDEYKRLLRERRAQDGWQSIETAPTDREVLISDGEYVYSAFRRWRGDGIHEEGWSVGFAWRSPVIRRPMYWMPLPAPPWGKT